MNALPSLVNLYKRKVVGNLYCFQCGAVAESIEHALFWCKKARQVWNQIMFGSILSSFKDLPTLDVLRGIFPTIKCSNLDCFSVIL